MSLGTHNPYLYGCLRVKKYNDKYKLTFHNILREKGYEERKEENQNPFEIDERVSKTQGKCLNNLSRARNTIFELAMCNSWDFFCTLTIDGSKHDRFSIDSFRLQLSQFIRDLRKKYKTKIHYLFVPEKHKDGAWHMHGLISGLDKQDVVEFSLKQKLPLYIKQKLQLGYRVYNWLSYSNKFGFCDLEDIADKNKVCSYITKYITKDLEHSIDGFYKNLYYCSTGLNRAEEICTIENGRDFDLPWTFENEYCKILWVQELPEAIQKELTKKSKDCRGD